MYVKGKHAVSLMRNKCKVKILKKDNTRQKYGTKKSLVHTEKNNSKYGERNIFKQKKINKFKIQEKSVLYEMTHMTHFFYMAYKTSFLMAYKTNVFFSAQMAKNISTGLICKAGIR